MVTQREKLPKKPGRPRAIPEEYESVVVAMYDDGDGYRTISRKLSEYGLNPDYTTVRRTLMRLVKVPNNNQGQQK
jgi:hypothetical protein